MPGICNLFDNKKHPLVTIWFGNLFIYFNQIKETLNGNEISWGEKSGIHIFISILLFYKTTMPRIKGSSRNKKGNEYERSEWDYFLLSFLFDTVKSWVFEFLVKFPFIVNVWEWLWNISRMGCGNLHGWGKKTWQRILNFTFGINRCTKWNMFPSNCCWTCCKKGVLKLGVVFIKGSSGWTD